MNLDITESNKPHNFLHEAAFSPHETSESALTETAYFLNRSPECFEVPSKRIRLNRYAVLEASKFV